MWRSGRFATSGKNRTRVVWTARTAISVQVSRNLRSARAEAQLSEAPSNHARTVSTGHGARRMTRSVVLPSNQRVTRPRPRVAITIMAAP